MPSTLGVVAAHFRGALALTPTVGTVTTPDPGPLPTQCIWVAKVRGPSGTNAWHTIASQFEVSGQNSWKVRRATYVPSQMTVTSCSNGTSNLDTRAAQSLTPSGGTEWIAVTRNEDGVNYTAQAFHSVDGINWTVTGTSLSTTTQPCWDSNTVMRIGAAVSPTEMWNDRIYSVELRHGLNPAGGPSWLDATVGWASTPDPGPLPNDFTFIWKVRSPPARGAIAAQLEGGAGQMSWSLVHVPEENAQYFFAVPDGTNIDYAFVAPVADQTGSDEYRALTVQLNNGSGRFVLTDRFSSDGVIWQTGASRDNGSTQTLHDSSTAVRIGHSLASGDVWQGRIYSVELRHGLDPAGGPAYLEPTVGTVTTPDPGVMPNEFTLIYKVTGQTAGQGTVAGQFDAGPYSWFINRNDNGNLFWYTSPDGGGATAPADYVLGPLATGQVEELAVSVTQNTGLMTSWQRTTSWQQVNTQPNVSRIAFDTNLPVRIGGIAPVPAYTWQGRIYSVELRHGLNPAAYETAKFLSPTIGTVSTPDPGPLPNDFTFVFKVRGPSDATGTIAAQYDPDPQRSWVFNRRTDQYMQLTVTPTGSYLQGVNLFLAGQPVPTGSDELQATGFTFNNGAGRALAHGWRHDGSTWVQTAAAQDAGATVTPFDSNAIVRIGDFDAFASQSFHGRIYSVELREGLDPNSYIDAYLTPTVGTVTTPDPGPPPAQATFVFTTIGPSGTGYQSIASNGVWSWILERHPTAEVRYVSSPDGSGLAANFGNVDPPTAAVETWALALNAATGAITTWSHDAAGAWTTFATVPGTPWSVFDIAAPITIGSGLAVFDGRIYSVECRTGLDPAAGTVLWRFDANEVPAGATTYTDPRGRTWTLTAANAITPKGPIWRFDAEERTGTGTSYVDPRGRTWTLTDAAAVVDPSKPIWRFDAEEYPGTGTSYADPRGRTWTLTNAAAIRDPDKPIWRFDAEDYPGTGTSYVDPRGRTWTLTSAAAIKDPDKPIWRFDAAEYVSGTSFTDARGRVWTLTNASAIKPVS